jgi:[ribosomal protein S5]-alanine N-acetyltransferase
MEGERIFLRPLRLEDAEQIFENVKKKEDRPLAYVIPYPYEKKDAIEFIEKSLKQGEAHEAYQLAIISKETGEVIGSCGLHNVNRDHRNTEIGYLIRAQDRGKGYATEAAKLLLKLAFDKSEFYKVQAKAFDINEPSKRVLEKNGFEKEGFFKSQVYKDGKYYDEVRYGLLREEWEG